MNININKEIKTKNAKKHKIHNITAPTFNTIFAQWRITLYSLAILSLKSISQFLLSVPFNIKMHTGMRKRVNKIRDK